MPHLNHCSHFPVVIWDSGNREKTSFIMPDALGKNAWTWGGDGSVIYQPVHPWAAGSYGPEAERSLSTLTPGSPDSQPQTDLSWPDLVKQFGKTKGE